MIFFSGNTIQHINRHSYRNTNDKTDKNWQDVWPTEVARDRKSDHIHIYTPHQSAPGTGIPATIVMLSPPILFSTLRPAWPCTLQLELSPLSVDQNRMWTRTHQRWSPLLQPIQLCFDNMIDNKFSHKTGKSKYAVTICLLGRCA